MTVSRVLGNSPRVSAAVRKKVMAAARALNYEPDPHLSRMMHMIRSRKGSKVHAVIAVVRELGTEDPIRAPDYQYVALEDIQRRAEKHGYHAEEFQLGKDGLSPERLVGVLQARGIEGMIVSPQSTRMLCATLDYSRFAVATFGYGLKNPSLHRAAGNMTLGIQMATAELAARGYRRIGLAITQWIDERAQHAYSGAMLHFQNSQPEKDRIPTLLFPQNDLSQCFDSFQTWMKANRPDALITFDRYVPDWLAKLGLKVPDDVGLVVHDWTQRMKGLAGIHQRREHVASAAVDLVATQLLQHEHGVPEVPRQILIPPAWVDGSSVGSRIVCANTPGK